MFIGPFEHHSNELPWRESIADVVVIPEDADGHIDLDAAASRAGRVRRPAAEDRLVLGGAATSPGSSATPARISDAAAPARRAVVLGLRRRRAVRRDRDVRAIGRGPASYKDAVFLSPHKFIGGPGTPGVLVVRRELLTNRVPDVAGGGTVAYVNPTEHRYLDRPGAARGGRHARRSSSRSGPGWSSSSRRPSGVDDDPRARGATTCAARSQAWQARARHRDPRQPRRPSGCRSSRSSSARPSGRYLHHNFVVAVLNDLFGIQSRGGCSCAGPYGHRLLGIDLERSHEFEREITGGCEGIKPGWVRVNFNYFISEAVFDYIVEAVALVADATAGGCCRTTGSSRRPGCGGTARARSSRRCGCAHVSLRRRTGAMRYPRHDDRAPESALAGYLAEARRAARRAARQPDLPRSTSATSSAPTSSTCAGSSCRPSA